MDGSFSLFPDRKYSFVPPPPLSVSYSPLYYEFVSPPTDSLGIRVVHMTRRPAQEALVLGPFDLRKSWPTEEMPDWLIQLSSGLSLSTPSMLTMVFPMPIFILLLEVSTAFSLVVADPASSPPND
jgi:hypothetical protein